MPSTRNAILTYIGEQLAAVAGMTAERVVVGYPTDKRLQREPVIAVLWEADMGGRADGMREADLTLDVALVARVDPLADKTQLLQLSDLYDEVQAKLEAIANADVNRLALSMVQDGPIRPGGYDDGDQYIYVSSSWKINYHRLQAAV